MKTLNVDCLTIIFNQIQDDKTLYSCLLVNKEWCNAVVPILWEKVKKSVVYYNKKLANAILSSLPPSSKQLLSDNGIKLPSTILLKYPLFNYINFCEISSSDDIFRLADFVDNNKRNLLEQEIYKLLISQCKNIKEFHWMSSHPLPLFPGASTCFSQLYSLSIGIDFVKSNALYEMAQICKDLNKLSISGSCQDISGLISLIDAQRNLKSVAIYHQNRYKGNYRKELNKDHHRQRENYCKELNKALERKNSTINDLTLSSVTTIPTSLINIEKISIFNVSKSREDVEEFRQYLAITEFPNLQHLKIRILYCLKEISLLIEKTKGNVLTVNIDVTSYSKDTGMIIKAIANNCPKIKELSTYLESKDFIQVKFLLLNCRNLESITFNSFDKDNNNNGDELFDILTNFTPKSLTHLSITNDWKCSTVSLERFLESCRERALFYFRITGQTTVQNSSIIRKYVDKGVIENRS